MTDYYDCNENFLRDINDEKGIVECFEKYGAVGVTNVLNNDECQETINDMENILKNEGVDSRFNIHDSSTYDYTLNIMNNYGMVGAHPVITTVTNRNRYHNNVKKVYSLLYNMPPSELLAQYDRLGWIRPTIGSLNENWIKYDTPYTTPGLHVDVDLRYYFEEELFIDVKNWLNNIKYSDVGHLLSENGCKNIKMGRQLQGVLNLCDNEINDGGFHFIPCGIQLLKEFYNENKKTF